MDIDNCRNRILDNDGPQANQESLRTDNSSSTIKTTKGLSIAVLRQLLVDIEEKGGIHHVSAKSICDRKPELYGRTKSDLRKQVRNKIAKWKLLTPESFQQVTFRLLPDATLNNTSNILPFHGSPPPSEHRTLGSTPLVSHQPFASPSTTPSETTTMMSIANTIPATASKDMTYIHRVLMAKDFVEIEVDIERPERNREAQVFHFMARRTNGKLHNGFTIEMCVDPRDYTNNHYQAYLLPDKHRVFIKVPAQCASFTLDHMLVAERERTNFCDKVQESRDVARNAIQDSETRVYKHLVLMFPGYMELSNAIYSPATADGKIRMVPVPYPGSVTLGGTAYRTLLCRVVWKLHIVEAIDRVVERQLNEGTYEDELVQALREGLWTNSQQTISSRPLVLDNDPPGAEAGGSLIVFGNEISTTLLSHGTTQETSAADSVSDQHAGGTASLLWPAQQTVAASVALMNHQYATYPPLLRAGGRSLASVFGFARPPTTNETAFADGRFLLSPQESSPLESILEHAQPPTSPANMARADGRFHCLRHQEEYAPPAAIIDPAHQPPALEMVQTECDEQAVQHSAAAYPSLFSSPTTMVPARVFNPAAAARSLTRTIQGGTEGALPDVLMDDEGGHLKRTYTVALEESTFGPPDVDI